MDVTWIEIFLLTSFAKLLLYHSYHSTDFEVHRNWLAITNSLPIKEWYYESTSPWTLDYPPFFAWFEYVLSVPASYIDSNITTISNLDYASFSVKLYQRLTVILSDGLLCYGCAQLCSFIECFKTRKDNVHQSKRRVILKLISTLTLLCHPGLLLVDHVHFQYNGLLSGIFLLSLIHIQDNIYLSGFLFSVLLNFKHIYLYVAPAYFVYMLRRHVSFTKPPYLDMLGLMKLGGTVIAVFTVALGPFLRHVPQLLSRLFPVHRGLCHAYWAPNTWALYNTADLLLAKVSPVLGITISAGSHASTSGLVQISEFKVLPPVTAAHCAGLTLLAMTPALVRLFHAPSTSSFLRAVTLCAFSSFLFGYHVHEKAVLVLFVPFAVVGLREKSMGELYLFMSLTGTYSLFPLLFQLQELPVKVVIFVLLHVTMATASRDLHPDFSFTPLEKAYLAGLLPHFILVEIILPFFLPRFQFLPLMVYSLYTAIGFIYTYVKLYVDLFTCRNACAY